MVAGIHHIKLPVSDVARSRAWYERVLGFETVDRVRRGRRRRRRRPATRRLPATDRAAP